MVNAQDSEGNNMRVKMQVADVSKALAAVGRINAAGNGVWFDGDDSYIIHKKTGRKTWLRKEQGVFVFDMWVDDRVTTNEQPVTAGNIFSVTDDELVCKPCFP